MSRLSTTPLLCNLAVVAVLGLNVPTAKAFDADAAQELAKQNNCAKCHAPEKKKDGPSFKETAAKYKGKPEGEDRIVKHLTTGEKAKFPDGHEEEHKRVKAKDVSDVKNLAAWILSQ
jgi:cytochrome c